MCNSIHLIGLWLFLTSNCFSQNYKGFTEHLIFIDQQTNSSFSETIHSEQEEKENQKRLKYIRQLYSTYPAINLPFTYQTQKSLAVTDIYTEDEIDTLIFGDDYPVSIIGIVPDSTNYFLLFLFNSC